MDDGDGGLGTRLLTCRQSAGLSQEELAERSGVSVRTISNLERGRDRWPYRDTLRRLADALGLSDTARAEFIGAVGRRLVSVGNGSTSTVAASEEPGPAQSGQPSPRQLPAPVPGFVGREHELAALSDMLHQDRSGGSAMVISVISGTAGVGKTALAVRWACEVADQFPDGQLHVDLRGYDADQPRPAADALAAFLRTLGMPGLMIPDSISERAAAYRSLLSGRRMLIVLDNARDAEQVRPLLPGSPACAVVVTSRDALAGLIARDGARRLELGFLPLLEAVAVLRVLIGQRAQAEPEAVTQLAALCCRLPLALRVAAELAVARPDTPLTALAGELADSGRRLDLLDAGGDHRTAVRAVLSWSYRQLDPHAAHMFSMTGLSIGQDFDIGSAAALAGVPPEVAARQVDQLARASLIQCAGQPGRYAMHDLLRDYARDIATAEYGEEQRRAAFTRLFGHYVHMTIAATAAIFPARRQEIDCARGAGTTVTDPAAARAWLDGEAGNLTLVTTHMTEHGWSGDAARLAAGLFPYLVEFGSTAEALTVSKHALRAARAIGDRGTEATALRNFGYLCLKQGRYREAARHFRRALALFREADDQAGEASALSNLAVVHRLKGRYGQAAVDQSRAVALYRQAGDTWAEALALIRLGMVEWHQGRLEEAADDLRQALTAARRIDDGMIYAQALTSLGVVECSQGRYPQATRHHRHAIALFRRINDSSGAALALNGLGETMLAAGHPSRAHDHHANALSRARQNGCLNEQARACHGLGRACLALGRVDCASSHLREALDVYTSLGAPEADQVRAELTTCRSGDRSRAT